jgi:hypothetical protein
LFKECFDLLVPTVTTIINKSIATKTFPVDLKKALVTPLLKKPSLDHDELNNYRPVSNLPYLAKIIEKSVVTQIQEHINNNNLLPSNQSAYRKYHSTETAMVKIMNDLLLAVDNRRSVYLILLDLSAAFDTVDHDLLLKRLENEFGVGGGVCEWLASYFSGRSQVVGINGTQSTPRLLKTGMPQGSYIGPFSFPLYTAPLIHIAESLNCSIHMYADDTQLYADFSDENCECTVKKMEMCIGSIRHWMNNNYLKLNDSKTDFLVVKQKGRVDKVCDNIKIGDDLVTKSNCVKNLGCLLDESLSMEKQVQNISKSCYYSLYQIGQIRENLTESTCTILVNSLVLSKLDYMNCLLVGLPDCALVKLKKIQNSAARLITKKRKCEHITPVLKYLHWLPVKFRIDYKILLLCYKAQKGLAPTYLADMLTPYKAQRTLRSADKNLLVEPKTRLKTYGDRAFSVYGPKIWNQLPGYIHGLNTLDSFKRGLKTYLFKCAFDHV